MGAPKGHPPYRDAHGNLPGGRPLKYDDAFIEAEADAFEAWMNDQEEEYWYEDFVKKRGYYPSMLSRWAKKNLRFKQVLREAHRWQRSKLIKMGISGKGNPMFVKFVLRAIHHMKEWDESELTPRKSLDTLIQFISEKQGMPLGTSEKPNEQK